MLLYTGPGLQGDLRLHHYAVRSYEDAVIKAAIWNKTESMDIWQYAVRLATSRQSHGKTTPNFFDFHRTPTPILTDSATETPTPNRRPHRCPPGFQATAPC